MYSATISLDFNELNVDGITRRENFFKGLGEGRKGLGEEGRRYGKLGMLTGKLQLVSSESLKEDFPSGLPNLHQ